MPAAANLEYHDMSRQGRCRDVIARWKEKSMEYVKFGRSGLKVSRLAYGLGLRGQEDADEAERAIERAVELGINFIDCANIYGFGDVYETRGTSE
ncbi:MAG: hypothetical protein F4049_16555 [Gemmatimonadetes bacterium]|nr:hypothetical protein [Gemmatimonadota bacterium]